MTSAAAAAAADGDLSGEEENEGKEGNKVRLDMEGRHEHINSPNYFSFAPFSFCVLLPKIMLIIIILNIIYP